MALTFNLTIDDTSPQISYLPNELDDPPTLQGGWESCDPVSHCSDSGLNDFLGQLGQWDTLHITGREGASFSINFTGECSCRWCNILSPGCTGHRAGVLPGGHFRPLKEWPGAASTRTLTRYSGQIMNSHAREDRDSEDLAEKEAED